MIAVARPQLHRREPYHFVHIVLLPIKNENTQNAGKSVIPFVVWKPWSRAPPNMHVVNNVYVSFYDHDKDKIENESFNVLESFLSM